MTAPPDYTNLRAQTPFQWYVGATYLALLKLTDIPIKEFNLNPAAGIELYRRGRPMITDLFGPVVRQPGVATPPVSYGHINALGAELRFPDDGEVNHETLCESLAEGIEMLKRPVNFATAGMVPFYQQYQQQMQAAFPDEPVGFGMGFEGPITTAYTLRRDAFFFDVLDQPQLCHEFLQRLVTSIVEYTYFNAQMNQRPAIDPVSSGLCDDVSSMLSPQLWPEFVIPYWEQYFQGRTTGTRWAHVEDLRPAHLHFLEQANISNFDPSISKKLNPRLIFEHCRVPFGWRLGSFHYHTMTCQDVTDFVFQSAADGASPVFTYLEGTMCDPLTVSKVQSFITACQEVERMFQAGATRSQIGTNVSPAGRQKFWEHWPE